MTDRAFSAAAAIALTRDDFEQAARTIAADVLRTPLIPDFGPDKLSGVMLKLEDLQPVGSFKIRCTANAASRAVGGTQRRVATASMGNFAQGLALVCLQRGLELTVHVPDNAARIKVDRLAGMGARIVEHSFDAWWRIMGTRETGRDDGVFLHPVCDVDVIAGNGTIGLELIEQMPELNTVVVPFGGGGLISGIALALRASGHSARVIAVEVETATPLAAAFAADTPVEVVRQSTFVDGIGSTRVLEAMWPLLRSVVDDVIVVPIADVRAALRSAAVDNHLVLEGAAAATLAAARSIAGPGVCAVMSGGNIDPAVLANVLGEGPR